MKVSEPLDRREFTLAAALAALAGATIVIEGGCGGGSSPAGSSGTGTGTATGPPSPVEGSVSDNHGHQAIISGAELQAGGAVSLNIRGEADHPHTVALTAIEVASIRDGGQVSKDASMTVDHMHRVTFRGQAPDGPGGTY